MSNLLSETEVLAGQASEIEGLARETDTPLDTVHRIYHVERAKLEQFARIKTYVPVLTRRRVKDLLQNRRHAREVKSA
jgi:Protein of unknown function (DUF3562)